jgi:NAD(P)-dependent dehydrogenase (short-subunit alcohol dehydrogenase family)
MIMLPSMQVTVRELARKGAKVILASRSIQRGEDAKKDICSTIASCDVDVWALDLSSLASIDAFATKYLESGPSKLDMLILNAGVMACPYAETADGVEMQFGTNHLGHFFLTRQLMPVLESSKARVVTVSSNAHEFGYAEGIRFNQLTNSDKYDQG